MSLKKIFFATVVAFLISASVFAQPKTLKIASIAPARSAWDLEAKRLAANWAKSTNNQIIVQYMNALAMGGESGVIQKLNSVRPGQKAPIDGAIFTSMGVDILAPDAHLLTLDIPFMFRTSEEVDYVMDRITQRVDDAVSEKGYKFLGLFNVGWCYFFTKKPVHSIDDLKTQKISANGADMPALTNVFKAAGFLTVDVPAAKLLSSMRTPGGTEGFFSIPMYAYAGQYTKSVPNILNIPLFPVLACLIVSKSTWDAIPESQKPAMLDALKTARDNFTISQKNSDKEYLDKAVSEGATLVTLSDSEMKAFRAAVEKDIPKMIETGIADTDFYNEIQTILKEYRGE